MPAKRSLTLALALLLVAAIPVRATGFPAMNVIDTIRPGVDSSYALWGNGRLGDFLYFGADDGTHGTELWRTNGTTTELVQDIRSGADGSNPYGFTALGGYLYFLANDGTNGNLWRVSAAGTIESASPAGTNLSFGCMCERPILTLNGRLFAPVFTDETGFEFAYLDEPTFGLPGTNRDGSVWSTALVLLAAVTAVAGAGLRIRGVRRG